MKIALEHLNLRNWKGDAVKFLVKLYGDVEGHPFPRTFTLPTKGLKNEKDDPLSVLYKQV